MHLDGKKMRQEGGQGQIQMKITDRNKAKVDILRYRFTWIKLL